MGWTHQTSTGWEDFWSINSISYVVSLPDDDEVDGYHRKNWNLHVIMEKI